MGDVAKPVRCTPTDRRCCMEIGEPMKKIEIVPVEVPVPSVIPVEEPSPAPVEAPVEIPEAEPVGGDRD